MPASVYDEPSAQHEQQRAQRLRKTARWILGVGTAVMMALGLVLLFLLTVATNNRQLYEDYYVWLFGLNVLVAGLLLLVLLWMGGRLLQRWHQRKFGSRLLLKLATIFALVGVLPGALIYTVSYQFVSRSIESWFDVKVEGALTAGVNLASVTLDAMANDMANNTRNASTQLGEVSDAGAGLVLERIRDQLGAIDVVLWNSAGVAVASAGESMLELSPVRPSAQVLRSLRGSQRPLTSIEGLDDDLGVSGTIDLSAVRVRVLVAVPNAQLGLLTGNRFLQATIALPATLVSNALAVQEAHREYQERSIARQGLRRMYIGTLTLSLFLAVFGAVLLAVLFGNHLAQPLLLLAQGVRDVARGDLTPKAVSLTRDEVGGLTRSFALMTQQLLEARTAVNQGVQEVQAARTNLQTILDNLTAGVLVLDAQWRVVIANPGAAHILRSDVTTLSGQTLASLPTLGSLAAMVDTQFAQFFEARSAGVVTPRWQNVFEFLPQLPEAETAGEVPQDKITLVVRGAVLPHDQRLVVFDDISEIVSGQRSKAWAEVARRVAHEIKNPLTPIQLSAERLAFKLSGKLPPAEEALLQKSVKTIVEQVAAMLRLVNEFRDYARLPAAVLQPVDVNLLVQDVLQLYTEEGVLVPVHMDLDTHCPRIAADPGQLRQVLHNLVQNAQDASLQRAQAEGVAAQPVCLSTQWNATTGRVRITVTDSGCGFPEALLQRAFEPYVTTKPKGTGLGLAVVKKIADEHGARVDLSNRLEGGVVKGAQVSLSFAPAESGS